MKAKVFHLKTVSKYRKDFFDLTSLLAYKIQRKYCLRIQKFHFIISSLTMKIVAIYFVFHSTEFTQTSGLYIANY